MEEILKGKDRNPGLIERVRKLEDDGLTGTVKRSMLAAGITLIVTAAPLMAIVMPKITELNRLLTVHAISVGAPH